MKVLYFHQHFSTLEGASGTRSYEFARQLIACGHEVTMVCGRHSADGLNYSNETSGKVDRREINGIKIIQFALNYSNYDNFFRRSISFIHFALWSLYIAFKEDYDLIFATSTPLTAGIPGIGIKTLRWKKPFVFEVRDLWPELPKAMGVIKNPIILSLISILEWSCYHMANSCIGLSPGIIHGIKRRSQKGKPITMIPNGCDLHLFHPGSRKDLNLPGVMPNDKVAIYTGAHGMANGLDAVIDCAAILKKLNRSDIKIVFIGDGILKPHLENRVKEERLDNCLFFDPLSKTEIAKILSSVDIGMQILANVPAFYYGTSPNKFFDFIASGLPVLINYPGWMADLTTENECGIVVPPNNPRAFADALMELADNSEKRYSMGKNACQLAKSKFDRAILSRQFVSWLETSHDNFHNHNKAHQ